MPPLCKGGGIAVAKISGIAGGHIIWMKGSAAMPWWVWVLVGVLALAGESASMALFLLNVGIAAFVVAALAAFGVPALGQAGVFVLLAIVLIGLVRPRLLQALGRGRQPRPLTTQEALVG